MVFQSRLEFVKKDVEQTLVSFFATKRQEAKKISPHCMMIVDQVEEFTMRGGKRTRAFLCWLGYGAVARIPPRLMHAMIGIELFQSFALIHDDIIDKDTIRRGGPTVHVQLGVPMAILAGDLALVWADELMGKAGEMNIYTRMKQEVIFGQSLDVVEEHMKVGIPKELIDTYKTAWYSVVRPLQIGAAIGGADEKLMESFVPYGLAVGQGYQLRDDFLDGVMSEEEFQKSVKKLVIPKSATILLTNFARFAITRQS